MNLTDISPAHVLGRALRAPLGLVPKRAIVPIMSGPLRGIRWVVGACTHGCWLGIFESDKQRALWDAIRTGDTVFDIGANVGFYTLLASRRVGPTGRVVAFEPSPLNHGFLRRHVAMNRADNVRVEEVAVGAEAGRLRFSLGGHPTENRFSPDGEIEVPVVALDELWRLGRIPLPQVVKIDVEGAELMVLRGARALLDAARPRIYLATHGAALHRDCVALLRECGYRVETIDGHSPECSDELVAYAPGGR